MERKRFDDIAGQSGGFLGIIQWFFKVLLCLVDIHEGSYKDADSDDDEDH